MKGKPLAVTLHYLSIIVTFIQNKVFTTIKNELSSQCNALQANSLIIWIQKDDN